MNTKRTRIQVAGLIAFGVSLLLAASCRTAALGQRDMKKSALVYVQSSEYTNTVNRLKVKPEEAERLVAEYIRAEKNAPPSQKVLIGIVHWVLVDESYLFSYKQKLGGIPLTGYYVDGNTGKVEFKKVEGSVPYPYQK